MTGESPYGSKSKLPTKTEAEKDKEIAWLNEELDSYCRRINELEDQVKEADNVRMCHADHESALVKLIERLKDENTKLNERIAELEKSVKIFLDASQFREHDKDLHQKR